MSSLCKRLIMQFWIHPKCLTYLLDFVADDAASQMSRNSTKKQSFLVKVTTMFCNFVTFEK